MNNAIQYIQLNDLIPGEFHPHLEYTDDNIENLTNSIKTYGILEPLIVRPKDNKYEIILGNRRYKAANNLGLEKIPVIILNLDDAKALEFVISDNIQRKELTSKEEAYLYEKVLSYPNTNKEKLSMNLGIPIDRITSKLNLLKKQKRDNNQNLSLSQNIPTYDNQNNSINNDIINLSELNKEEKEREDYNMNDNQFMNNNNNNTNTMNNQGVMPPAQQQAQQEPTFGGRFFPSLEDEPTNMNLNNNINMQQGQQEFINNPSSPLIDLTDLSSDTSQSPTPLNQSMPNLSLSPQQDTSLNNIETSPIDLTQPDSIPNPSIDLNTPNYKETNPQIDINSNIQPQPPIMGMEQNNSGIDIQQTPEQPISSTESVVIPNMPTQQPIMGMEQNNPGIDIQQTPEQPINIDNLNNNLSINNQIQPPIDIAQPIDNTSSQKDILPVINIIKSIAINLEAFGYKLNVNELDSDTTYNITIEVEK